MTRRVFLRRGLLLAPLLAPASLLSLAGPAPARPLRGGEGEKPGAGRLGLAIFTKRLGPADFRRINSACHQAHSVPEGEGPQAVKWIWSAPYAEAFPGEMPEYVGRETLQRRFPLLCNHCGNPVCVRVCPSGAAWRRDDGLVGQDYSRCIGCRSCMAACPYGARSFNFSAPDPAQASAGPASGYPARPRGVVEKCNFCAERLDAGLEPHCVEASAGAMLFGDLADPDSAISRALRVNLSLTRSPGLGLAPAVYYVL